MSSQTLGVVLLNFGGPASLTEVPSFLQEILTDPNAIQIPVPHFAQNLLMGTFARLRAKKVIPEYEKMGGKSPILESSAKQNEALQKELKQRNCVVKVYDAYRYVKGQTAKTAQQIIEDDIEKLLLLPMYPHFCYATTGSSVEQLFQEFKKLNYQGEITCVRSYPEHPKYVQTLHELIEQSIHKHQLDSSKTVILCSAHGLPQSYVDNGDPYQVELLATLKQLQLRLPSWRFELSFQSKVGPAKWLTPATDDAISNLAKEGIQNVLVVPISFVNDHLETLVELDETYFEMAREQGITPLRIDPIETHPQFMSLLADEVEHWQKSFAIPAKLLLPPSQSFQRYIQWVIYGLLIAASLAVNQII